MPKFINRYIGKLASYEREVESGRFDYALGRRGFVELYESLNLHPGCHFVRYFFSLEDDDLEYTDQYIFTACGDLKMEGCMLTIANTRPNGSTYTFEIERAVKAYSIDLE